MSAWRKIALNFFAQTFQLARFFGGSWDYGQNIPVEKPLLRIYSQMVPLVSILVLTICSVVVTLHDDAWNHCQCFREDLRVKRWEACIMH